MSPKASKKPASRPRAALITGANRGLGLALVKHYLALGWRVRAACRTPARAGALKALAASQPGRLEIHALDVARSDSLARLKRALARAPLDLVINNAGIYGGHHGMSLAKTDYRLWQACWAVNVMAPARIAAAFAPALARSPAGVLINISSIMASLALNDGTGSYAYRSSKAALNMVSRTLANELPDIIVAAIHPGWVKTDMGGKKAPLMPEESAAAVAAVVARLKRRDSGGFFDYRGRRMPW